MEIFLNKTFRSIEYCEENKGQDGEEAWKRATKRFWDIGYLDDVRANYRERIVNAINDPENTAEGKGGLVGNY